MKVLLNEKVENLGYRGDIVAVKPGYFRNYLFPKSLAVPATPALIKLAEGRKEKVVMEKSQVLENAKDVLKKLKGLELKLKASVSDKGTLYAALAEADIVEAIKAEAKVTLEPSFIKMEHIKELGEYSVKVQLGDDLEEEVKVIVESEE